MAMQVNGYISPYSPSPMLPRAGALQVPAAPMAPAAPAAPSFLQQQRPVMGVQSNGYPAPVVVPVNNYNAQTAQYVQSIDQARVAVAGAIPGKVATNAVREYKGYNLGARARPTTARGMRNQAIARSNANGALMGTITGAIKSSLIFNGLVSLAINGYKVMNNQETMADGGANFVGDLTSAVVGGAAAGATAGLATMVLGSVLGTGFLLTLVGMGAGALGYFVADSAWRQTQIYNQIKSSVHQML